MVIKKMGVKEWLKGLISAGISGSATGLTVMIVDPVTFNFETGLKKLLLVTAVAGVIAAANYLKKSPIPDF